LGNWKYFVIVAVLFSVGIISTQSFASTTHTVTIADGSAQPGCEKNDLCLIPSEIYIDVGDYIEFDYEDSPAMHYLTAGSAEFGPTEWNLRGPYNEKGFFPYFDMVHPWIQGAVIVGADTQIDQTEEIETKFEELAEVKEERDITRLQKELEKAYERNNELSGIIDSREQLILDLKFQNRELKLKIDDLQAIIMEQIKVIMETLVNLKNSIISVAPSQNDCDPSYPEFCIPPYPPDLDCSEIQYSNFKVLQPDPHGFDRDKDGIGCES